MDVRLLKVLKIVIPFIILGFLSWNILKNWDQILVSWKSFNLLPLSFSLILLLFVYPEAAFAWYVLIKGLGISRSVSKIMYVWILANASRYIPGFVWQYVGRVALAQQVADIPKRYTIISFLTEIFFSLTAASIVSFILLPSYHISEVTYKWVILIPLLLIFFHPVVLSKFVFILARIFKRNIGSLKFYLSVKYSLIILLLHIFNFLLNGTALVFLVSALGLQLTPAQTFFIIGSYAFSWMIGYITIFAPGGVGVTELALAYFLGSLMSFPLASLIVLMYRVLLSICEVIVFLITLRLKP